MPRLTLRWPMGNRVKEGFQTSSTLKIHSRHIAFLAELHAIFYPMLLQYNMGTSLALKQVECKHTHGFKSL